MSVAKVIELLAEGNTIESAVESAASNAAKTIDNVQNVYVKDIQAVIENGRVTKYRVNTKVTFVVNENERS